MAKPTYTTKSEKYVIAYAHVAYIEMDEDLTVHMANGHEINLGEEDKAIIDGFKAHNRTGND